MTMNRSDRISHRLIPSSFKEQRCLGISVERRKYPFDDQTALFLKHLLGFSSSHANIGDLEHLSVSLRVTTTEDTNSCHVGETSGVLKKTSLRGVKAYEKMNNTFNKPLSQKYCAGMFPYKALFIFIFIFGFAKAGIRISLDSNEINGTWRIYNGNKSIDLEGSVPGGIYSDLQDAKIIHDNLFYRFNDQAYRWVGKENWTYVAIFDVPLDIFKKNVVNIVFHGIDTVAEIYLNGQEIGFVNNMFVRYVIPVKAHLKEKRNVLKVKFRSPIHEALTLAEKQWKKYKIPPECPPVEQHGECHVNLLRKMQASFSWDWGPAFPSVGIWKSVEIEAFDHAVIRDVTITTKKESSKWIVNSTSYIESYYKEFCFAHVVTLYLEEGAVYCEKPIFKSRKISTSKNYNFTSDVVFEIEQEQIEPWWPNGYGNQTLYKITVELIPLNATRDDQVESMKEMEFGFRTIELVQEKVKPKSEGLSFYFKVNGVPIFAKGSNWIPGHILPELGSEESVIQHALLSAKEAHMNMLRVWGGGVYESDLFYKLADELGILIWQDLMFAVALYPADKKFLDNVAVEVEQQIRRLQYHPSIAVWAGNNENEIALRGNWFDTKNNFELYGKDYIKLYVDTIEPIVHNVDDSRWFAVSSPSNGLKSREEGHIAQNPGSPLFGDVHYYNYEDDPWNVSNCINTRFASEYGFQSLPSFITLSKVSKAEDRKLTSKFTKSRQHQRQGYENIINLMKYNLPLPADDGSESFFKTFIYYSQISQAMAVKTQTEKYRRDRSRLTENNEKFTMGALYWQLNDVWEAPTWSSIEYGGRWKMLHYYSKKFFAPVLVSAEMNGNNVIDVFVVSDLLHDIPHVQFNISVYSWSSFHPKKTISSLISVDKAKSKIYATIILDELLRSTNCTKNTCFLYFTLKQRDYFNENSLFLSPFSNVPNLEPANIKVRVNKTERANVLCVELKTDKIAPFLWLETEEKGQFSDNGFLLKHESLTVKFRSRDGTVDLDRFKKTLKVRSLLT